MSFKKFPKLEYFLIIVQYNKLRPYYFINHDNLNAASAAFYYACFGQAVTG